MGSSENNIIQIEFYSNGYSAQRPLFEHFVSGAGNPTLLSNRILFKSIFSSETSLRALCWCW